jgi:hypothetical protein
MWIGRPRTLALGLAALGLVAAGCAQDGTFVGPRPNSTVGSLKTSVTQLEHDNEQMRKQVAGLEADKRRLTEKLSQERLANDDLSTRLDNARALLGRKGPGEGSSDTSQADADWSDSHPGRTAPASRSGRSPRKPPFAQIGGIRPAPEADDPDTEDEPSPAPAPTTRIEPASAPARGQESLRWLPIATGAADSSPRG